MKRKLIRWITRRNFYISNFYEIFKVERAYTKKETILVYQMGKVGSTSLYQTLQKKRLEASIYHIHRLQPEAIKNIKDFYRKRFPYTRKVYEHVVHSQCLRRRLNKGFKTLHPKWKIITLVRDPVAQSISKFFQELRHSPELTTVTSDDEIDSTVKVLIQEYYRRYINSSHPFVWFDIELSSVFEIDNPLKSFSKSDGFKIYSYDHIDLLVLKLERISEFGEEALKEFLDVENIKLVTANEREKEGLGQLYEKFKRRIQFPSEYLDKMYRFPHVENVYSQGEIAGFYRRWQSNK